MQLIPAKPLSQIWLKASVVGSIWAAFEIILGSFLHNLKVPLSGMFLSIIGVWLIISFLQVWKENGLVWRAGIICALMKSISPSAFIIGPMIGIFTEALLIELFIFVFGKNIVGYLVAGSFAVLSTLLHKVVSLLILYGFDLIKILADLYQYAVKQIGLSGLSPWILLTIITAIYITTGMTGAMGGYLTGRMQSRKIRDYNEMEEMEIVLQSKNQLRIGETGHSYSLLLLSVNVVSLVTILFLINLSLNIPALISGIVYTSFCIFHYKNSLKRLNKISFWLSFFIITFAAAFLWNGFSRGAFFSAEGLMVGLRMNARAVVLILGFAAISVELKNPVIKAVLYHRGFASLYQSLSLSFSALPFIISNLSKKANGAPAVSGKSFRSLLTRAEMLLKVFEKEHSQRAKVVIITGDIGQGKTTLVNKVISSLKDQKIMIGGFLSIGNDEKGIRKGFTLYNIPTKGKIELCSDSGDDKNLRLGRYYFNKEALSEGLKILSPENLKDKQLIVIDEIGPLELSGRGWNSAIENLTRNSTVPQLWVVRRSLVRKIISRWNTGDIYVFDIEADSEAVLVHKLLEVIKQQK